MTLLRILKIISGNIVTHFWRFWVSLSVSQNFEYPQMTLVTPKIRSKMKNFTKITQNQQMLIFRKISSTVLWNNVTSTFGFDLIQNKQKFVILWPSEENKWKKILTFFHFFNFQRNSFEKTCQKKKSKKKCKLKKMVI